MGENTVAGPERLEFGSWSRLSTAEAEGGEGDLRDYYVARSQLTSSGATQRKSRP